MFPHRLVSDDRKMMEGVVVSEFVSAEQFIHNRLLNSCLEYIAKVIENAIVSCFGGSLILCVIIKCVIIS